MWSTSQAFCSRRLAQCWTFHWRLVADMISTTWERHMHTHTPNYIPFGDVLKQSDWSSDLSTQFLLVQLVKQEPSYTTGVLCKSGCALAAQVAIVQNVAFRCTECARKEAESTWVILFICISVLAWQVFEIILYAIVRSWLSFFSESTSGVAPMDC